MNPIQAVKAKRDELAQHHEAVRAELIATEGAIQTLDGLLQSLSAPSGENAQPSSLWASCTSTNAPVETTTTGCDDA